MASNNNSTTSLVGNILPSSDNQDPTPKQSVADALEEGDLPVNWNYAQQSGKSGYIPPFIPEFLPGPDTPMTEENKQISLSDTWNQVANEAVKESTTPRWKDLPKPTWNPWPTEGYARRPNIPEISSNPGIHNQYLYSQVFGAKSDDWRKDNPAGWFNMRTDDDAALLVPTFWERFLDTIKIPAERAALANHIPSEISSTFKDPNNPTEEEILSCINMSKDDLRCEDTNILDVLFTVPQLIGTKSQLPEANYIGPHFLTPESTKDYYGAVTQPVIQFPTKATAQDDGFAYGSEAMKDTGVHEATHAIDSALALNSWEPGVTPKSDEVPTTIMESIYGRPNGIYRQPILSNGNPLRDENDFYFLQNMPPLEDIPKESIPINRNFFRFWNMPQGKKYVPPVPLTKFRFSPDTPTGVYFDRFGKIQRSGGDIFNPGQFFNVEHKIEELPPSYQNIIKNLGQQDKAFIDAKDNPVEYAKAQDRVARLLYPLYGQNSIWAGGIEGLSSAFHSRQISAHPVNRILETLRPQIEPIINDALTQYNTLLAANQLQSSGMPEDQSDFVNQYLLDHGIDQWEIIRNIEEQFPELRPSVEAAPSWLVDAQRQFSILPTMGPTDVRTIEQYDDIAKYVEFYKRLDELIKQYNQGNGLYGV